MPSTTRPLPDGTRLRQRLSRLRRRRRFVTAFRGVSWLLTVVLATAAVAGLLDWRWHLPGLVRAVTLAGTLAGAGYVAFRYLLRPLAAPDDDLTLALRVEEHYPGLNDALASTVQFLEQGESAEGPSSPSLRREAVRRALGRAEGYDFGRVVDTRGLRAAGLSVAGAGTLALTLLVLFPSLAATALVRLADPFGARDWPTLTRLELETPRLRIGRNEPYDVRGKVRGVIPPQATVSFRFEGFPAAEHTCDITPGADGTGRLVAHLDPSRVQRTFHFQVRAGDAVSPEYEVTVLPPPVLVSLDGKPSPQVRLDYPAYTGLPSPEQLSPGTGNIEAVVGTVATLRAAADRPLRRAWIEYQPEVHLAPLAAFLAPLGLPLHDAGAPAALALMAGGRLAWTPEPAVLDGDRRVFTVIFRPRLHGMYSLHLEDESGLRSSRLFELRLKPDPAPNVQLVRPSPTRDVLTVLPTAELALEVTAEDSQFALRSVFLEYHTGREEPARRLFLYHHAAALKRLAPATGPGVLAAALRPTRLEFRRGLALAALRHPGGSPLKDGDVVLLQACADDFDDVAVDKQPGRSHQVEIHVVGRNALDLVLNQEQARVQQELVRLREKQREASQKVTEVENRLKKGEKLRPEDLDQLLQAEQAQQQVRERVGPREQDGLRAEVGRILETVRQNRLENSGVRDRMRRVQSELDRLARNELQQIEPRLTNARKLAELLDEKARAERRQQLEAGAREAEREAHAAEEAADKKAAEAERAEKRAEQDGDEAEKARHRTEARQQHERAQELRQRVQELHRQAQRERQEAARQPDEAGPRRELADARRGQEEVDKTLADLLQHLEPFTHTHEIKGEAKRLLQEQQQLRGAVEKFAEEQKAVGKPRNELTPKQRAELGNLKDAQHRLEERARQLIGKMERVAEDRVKKDPETAGELREAAEQARQEDIEGRMKAAREQIDENKLSQAQESQKAGIAGLEKLVKTLEDRREAELDRLAKKLRKAEKKLAELVEEQEQLRKKMKEAGRIADPARREEELKRLARRQKELRQKTEEMVQQLSRLRSQRASQALGQAGGEMDEAGQQLSRGEQADEKNEEALDRLKEAQEELEQARKQAEEELARERLARVADVIKRLKERQEALIGQVSDIRQTVLRNKGWTRTTLIVLGRKADAQQALAEDTAVPAEKDLKETPVFARLLKRSSETMTAAAERLKEFRAARPNFDEEALRLQQHALRRLTQVLDAVKSEAESGQSMAGGGGGGGGGGSGGSPQGDDSIPPLAQLKLLRAVQKEINDRTEALKKQYPDLENLDEKGKAELRALGREQKDVAELVDELTRPAGEPEGDKR